MQTIQFIRSHCPELIEGSKCEHLQYSLNVVAILPRHASSFYKGGLRRILHRVHRRIGGPHPRFNLTVEKNPVHPEPVELSKCYFFVPVLNQVLTIGQDIFSIKAKKLKTTTITISL